MRPAKLAIDSGNMLFIMSMVDGKIDVRPFVARHPVLRDVLALWTSDSLSLKRIDVPSISCHTALVSLPEPSCAVRLTAN